MFSFRRRQWLRRTTSLAIKASRWQIWTCVNFTTSGRGTIAIPTGLSNSSAWWADQENRKKEGQGFYKLDEEPSITVVHNKLGEDFYDRRNTKTNCSSPLNSRLMKGSTFERTMKRRKTSLEKRRTEKHSHHPEQTDEADNSKEVKQIGHMQEQVEHEHEQVEHEQDQEDVEEHNEPET